MVGIGSTVASVELEGARKSEYLRQVI